MQQDQDTAQDIAHDIDQGDNAHDNGTTEGIRHAVVPGKLGPVRLSATGQDVHGDLDLAAVDLLKNGRPVHIHKEGISGKERMYHAARRWSPVFRRGPGENREGRGIEAHMVLETWTIACKNMVAYLASTTPTAFPVDGVSFGTGYAFFSGKDEERVGALHKVVDGEHVLLLNPLKGEEGAPAFDIRQDSGSPGMMGLADLLGEAAQQVSRMVESMGGDYAITLGRLATGFMSQERQRVLRVDIRNNLDAVRAAYGSGVSRIQSLDIKAPIDVAADTATDVVTDAVTGAATGAATGVAATAQEGGDVKARPAARLRTLANPATTLAAGTAIEVGGEDEVPALLAYIAMTMQKQADGTVLENRDAASALEKSVSAAIVEACPAPVAAEAVQVPTVAPPLLDEPFPAPLSASPVSALPDEQDVEDIQVGVPVPRSVAPVAPVAIAHAGFEEFSFDGDADADPAPKPAVSVADAAPTPDAWDDVIADAVSDAVPDGDAPPASGMGLRLSALLLQTQAALAPAHAVLDTAIETSTAASTSQTLLDALGAGRFRVPAARQAREPNTALPSARAHVAKAVGGVQGLILSGELGTLAKRIQESARKGQPTEVNEFEVGQEADMDNTHTDDDAVGYVAHAMKA